MITRLTDFTLEQRRDAALKAIRRGEVEPEVGLAFVVWPDGDMPRVEPRVDQAPPDQAPRAAAEAPTRVQAMGSEWELLWRAQRRAEEWLAA